VSFLRRSRHNNGVNALAPNDSQNSGPLFRLAQIFFLFIQRFRRGMTLGVRAMVLDQSEQILLVRHSYVKGWHMPGGGVEVGETLEKALAKELLEEANVKITGETHLLGFYLNSKAALRDHVAVYLVRDFEQIAPKLPDREILEARFFPLSELPEGTTSATKRRIAEALSGAAVSQFW
jgi:ADP-ribose pyrophosphatase YjhB (NUDIX family)